MTEEEERERQDLIRSIESLYPTDSEFPGTADIGRRLLVEAKLNVCPWRDEPMEVLRGYARLCVEMERDHIAKFNPRKSGGGRS